MFLKSLFSLVFLLEMLLIESKSVKSKGRRSLFGSEPISESWDPMMASAGCYVHKDGTGECTYSFAFSPKFASYNPKKIEYSLRFIEFDEMPKLHVKVDGTFEDLSGCPGSFDSEAMGYLCYNGLYFGENPFDKNLIYEAQVAVRPLNSNKHWSKYEHLATLKFIKGREYWEIQDNNQTAE